MNNPKDQYSLQGLSSQATDRKILERAGGFRVPQGRSREEALELLKKNPLFREPVIIPVKKARLRIVYALLATAASLLLLAGLWRIFIYSSDTQLMAGRGEVKDITLPDGTDVRINSESSLAYDEKGFSDERKLTLKGEGFFKVKKGSTFTVSTKDGDITVLGTSFNIYSREDGFRVSCFEGRVSVSNGSVSLILNPGQTALRGSDGLFSYEDARISNAAAWLNGEFYFENAPLSSVFSEVERQFNIMFAVRTTESMYFTGSFANKDLETALESICVPMGLDYDIRDNKIFISKSKGK